ncbi:RDD family protein [Gordonia phthalatica]|uniref:RDD family protein n=1 Tax=Gordonia phthalatica TaxID=1136941 RepID=UPI0007861446|nr:RDD family protein [Gordonia phthalatica]
MSSPHGGPVQEPNGELDEQAQYAPTQFEIPKYGYSSTGDPTEFVQQPVDQGPYGQDPFGQVPFGGAQHPATQPYTQPQYSPAENLPPEYQQTEYGQPGYLPSAYPQPEVQPYYAPAPYTAAPYGAMPGYSVPTDDFVDIAGVGRVQPATFLQRALARLIDSVVNTALLAVVVVIGDRILRNSGPECVADGTRTNEECLQEAVGYTFSWIFLIIVVGMLCGVLYEWLMIGLAGATLGKMAMRLTVVDEVTGRPIGLGAALIRPLIPFLSFFICFPLGVLVVYLSPVFDDSDQRRGWHDKAAKDIVIVKQ